MLTCDYCITPRKRVNYSVSAFYLLIITFFIASCQQAPPPPARAGYSKDFLPVLDKASELFDSGKEKQGIDYIDSAIRNIANPNVNDKFRVLGFHYIYWNKVKHDHGRALLYADSMLVLAKKSANPHD